MNLQLWRKRAPHIAVYRPCAVVRQLTRNNYPMLPRRPKPHLRRPRDRKGPLDPVVRARILADVERDRADRDQGYRQQALNLFPHVCARCGREFSGKDLRELTVHHKDHNHLNNPPDGSNWELLCLYCHDNEHQTPAQRDHYEGAPWDENDGSALLYNAFEGLKDLQTPSTGPPETPAPDAGPNPERS